MTVSLLIESWGQEKAKTTMPLHEGNGDAKEFVKRNLRTMTRMVKFAFLLEETVALTIFPIGCCLASVSGVLGCSSLILEWKACPISKWTRGGGPSLYEAASESVYSRNNKVKGIGDFEMLSCNHR